jgi:hypothetical protein
MIPGPDSWQHGHIDSGIAALHLAASAGGRSVTHRTLLEDMMEMTFKL